VDSPRTEVLGRFLLSVMMLDATVLVVKRCESMPMKPEATRQPLSLSLCGKTVRARATFVCRQLERARAVRGKPSRKGSARSPLWIEGAYRTRWCATFLVHVNAPLYDYNYVIF